MSQFEQSLFQYLENIKKQLALKPLNLGGIAYSGGGYGQPPGGYIGVLPQTRIAYDLSEASNDGWVESGAIAEDGTVVSGTLLDNLNHIRYRITTLEEGGNLEIQEDDVIVLSGVTIVNFEGGVEVTDEGSGKVTVNISGGSGGGSITVEEDDVEVATNVTVINFEGGAEVTDEGSGKVTITVSGGSGTSDHNELTSLQGGATAEYYHLTNAEYVSISGVSGFTTGSIPFVDTSGNLEEDNDKLFFDDTNDILYVGDKEWCSSLSGAKVRTAVSSGGTGFAALSYGSIPINAGWASGGTKASPTALTDNSNIFWLSAVGYDGVDWYGRAFIKFIADQTWEAGKHGTRIEFEVTANDSITQTDAMVLYSNTAVFPGTIKTNSTGVVDVAAGITANVDAALTITTALTNNTGAGVLTWPAGGATLTIPATGTAALGTGTANYLTKWSATNTLTNSLIRDDGTTVAIGAAPNNNYKLYTVISPTATSGTYASGYFISAGSPSGASTGLYIGLYGASYNEGANSVTSVEGLRFEGGSRGSGNVTYVRGIMAGAYTNTASGGNVVVATGIQAYVRKYGDGGAITYAYGVLVNDIYEASSGNWAITTGRGNVLFNKDLADDADFRLNGTTYALIQTDASDDELYLCNHASAKLSFFAATPIVREANTVAIDTLLVDYGLRASGGTANFATAISTVSTITSKNGTGAGVVVSNGSKTGNYNVTIQPYANLVSNCNFNLPIADFHFLSGGSLDLKGHKITMTGDTSIESDCTLNLNGFKLTITGGHVSIVGSGGTLTLGNTLADGSTVGDVIDALHTCGLFHG